MMMRTIMMLMMMMMMMMMMGRSNGQRTLALLTMNSRRAAAKTDSCPLNSRRDFMISFSMAMS
eukprot:12398473-Karenia_brevis.AAC.1